MSEKQRTWLSAIARIGYIAKGVVYFVVGLLSLQVALGMGGNLSGTRGVLSQLLYQPLGSILLIVCMAGLFAHAIWRIIQGVFDPENREKSSGTFLFRTIDILTGLLYISLSYAAWQIMDGLKTTSGDQSAEIWVGKVLLIPFGSWIVLFFACIITIAGLYQFYSSYTASFDYSFDVSRMDKKEKIFLRQLGRIGIAAWGIVYCMIAFLFYKAAINTNASEAGGLGDALKSLSKQPYGIWVLGITSAGLLIYGIYLLVLSYYHKIYAVGQV